MSFIVKNPISIPKISTPPSPPLEGTRGLYATQDGWHDIDDKGNDKKIATSDEIEGKLDKDEVFGLAKVSDSGDSKVLFIGDSKNGAEGYPFYDKAQIDEKFEEISGGDESYTKEEVDVKLDTKQNKKKRYVFNKEISVSESGDFELDSSGLNSDELYNRADEIMITYDDGDTFKQYVLPYASANMPLSGYYYAALINDTTYIWVRQDIMSGGTFTGGVVKLNDSNTEINVETRTAILQAMYNEILEPSPENWFITYPNNNGVSIVGLNPQFWNEFKQVDTIVVPYSIGGMIVNKIEYNNNFGGGKISDETKHLRFPNSIFSITGSSLFSNSKIESFNIPTSCQYLSGVNNCTELTEIITPIKPNWELSISQGTFSGCSKLDNIDTIIDGIKSINSNSFRSTGITNVTLPESVVCVGDSAFCSETLKTLTVLNPSCDFNNADPFGGHKPELIRGYRGSTAETLADAYEIKFEALDDKKESVSNKVDVIDPDAEYGEEQYATAKSVGAIWKGANEVFGFVDGRLGDIETALQNKEDTSNKTTEINADSTDEQYPTAKAVRDAIVELNGIVDEAAANIIERFGVMEEQVNTSLDTKASKTDLTLKADKSEVVSISDTTTGGFTFIDMSNSILRYKAKAMNMVRFFFQNAVYSDDYTAELSFNSGATPTTITYSDSGILNWLGTDCSLQDGLSIFAPTANKHYDIVFYFNGTCFVGLVNGFEMATVNNKEIENREA